MKKQKFKHIGIVGITAEGASLCYKTIVSESAKILGPRIHPEVSLNNPPFIDIYQAQNKRDWKTIANICTNSLKKLASVGTDFAVIPSNLIHFAIAQIRKKSPILVLSIIDMVINQCKENNYKKAGVLGIGITMSDGSLRCPAKTSRYRICAVPSGRDQELINNIIFAEIVPGIINQNSTDKILEVIERLKNEDCDVIILGCTELPLVINEDNSPLPVIDTTRLLAQKALEFAIS